MLYKVIYRVLKNIKKIQLKEHDIQEPLRLIDDYKKKFNSEDGNLKLIKEIFLDNKDSVDLSYILSDEYKKYKKDIIKKSDVFKGKPYQLGALDYEIDTVASILTQFEKPSVLEVGVSNGFSSSIMYHCLLRNSGSITSIDYPRFYSKSNHYTRILLPLLARKGMLEETGTISDLHPGGVVPSDKYAGWLVPMEYRYKVPNVTVVGDAFSVLKDVNKKFDFVVLDAMKDYNSRIMLFNIVLEKMNKSSICIQDGYWVNSAFEDFCKQNDLKYWKAGRIGIFITN